MLFNYFHIQMRKPRLRKVGHLPTVTDTKWQDEDANSRHKTQDTIPNPT